MPGVDLEKIQKSMILHFDPNNRSNHFDVAQLPSFFKTVKLPVLIRPFRYKTLEQWRADLNKDFTSEPAVTLSRSKKGQVEKSVEVLNSNQKGKGVEAKKLWDDDSTFAYLEGHAKHVFKGGPVFQKIDWAPKNQSRYNEDEDEELDPLSPKFVDSACVTRRPSIDSK